MQAVTAVTLREKLLSVGVDALLVDELVTVATRVNYGQMMMMMMMMMIIMIMMTRSDAGQSSCICGLRGPGGDGRELVGRGGGKQVINPYPV